MNETENYILRFWAKTSHDAEKAENAFHPLICHLIDVATAAHALWEKVLPKTTKISLAKPFDLENDLQSAGCLIAFLIGLHDLGKCSPPFALRGQAENKNSLNESLKRHSRKSFYGKKIWGKLQTIELLALYQNTDCDCEITKSVSDAPHNFVTAVTLPPILHNHFGFPEKLAENIAEIIGGHHGTFPPSKFLNNSASDAFCGDSHWRDAQAKLTETLADLFDIEQNFSHLPDKKLDNATAMMLAGLTTVADWIGSNTDFFKSKVEDWQEILKGDYQWFEVEEYLDESKQQASEALEKLGWTNWVRETNEKSFEELFTEIKDKKRHLQEAAIQIAKEENFNSPGIAVIEAPTGEGKTEAAMYLADAWNAKLGTRGIYFALPTQATSDQMFGRVKEFLEARFSGEDLNVQLMLRHGHASISDAFIENVIDFGKIENTYDDADKKAFSNVAAAEWFTYTKRGLLVPFGVGTIDQILLAVLQTKHVFVRLFGLANKTVIIDEVHAYDAYMSTLLERLLEWLAALGSPVVVLSATLPKAKRDVLIKAYLKGLGQKFEDGEKLTSAGEKDEYPRSSYATAAMPEKSFHIRGLKTSKHNERTVHLEWTTDDGSIELLKSKLASGGCAAIISNTVDRAQTLYAKLSEDQFFKGKASDGKSKLDLLHARFRYKEREQIVERNLQRFGKPDKNGESPNRPDTAVLISTQIIEQSLDLDFDLMISELAPVDLLLQRAGRLQRHSRDRKPELTDAETGKPKATFYLIKPPLNENGDLTVKDNLPDFGKSGLVYDKHILLRSWLKLKDKDKIEIPDDVERLIEDVYNKKIECFDEKYRNLWEETKYNSDNKLREKRMKAKAVFLTDFDDEDFYDSFNFQLDEEDPEKHQTLRAHTRDEEKPSVSVVLLTRSEADSVNLEEEPAHETTKFLIRREVKISRSGLTQKILAEDEFKNEQWKKSPLLRHHRLIVLDEGNRKTIGATKLILDNEKGFVYENNGGKSE